MQRERDNTARACFQTLETLSVRIAKDWKKPCPPKLAAQTKLLAELDALATACRDLIKDIDLVCKLGSQLVEAAEKDENDRAHDTWDRRSIEALPEHRGISAGFSFSSKFFF